MIPTPPGDRTHCYQARALLNQICHTQGETVVELYDDAYYFWHPFTESFLSEGPKRNVIGTPTATCHWEVRRTDTGSNPSSYTTFWSQRFEGNRKRVLDLVECNTSSGGLVGTWPRHEGDNQKWILKSDGDRDG